MNFLKLKESFSTFPEKLQINKCNILSRFAVSNKLIVAKLKGDLQHRGHVYFEPVRLYSIYKALAHLKSRN